LFYFRGKDYFVATFAVKNPASGALCYITAPIMKFHFFTMRGANERQNFLSITKTILKSL